MNLRIYEMLILINHKHIPYGEELSHLLPAIPHQLLVFANAQLLAVHNACALGSGLVLVVGIFLQMHLTEPRLLLVIRLLLLVGHGLPARSCMRQTDTDQTQPSYRPSLSVVIRPQFVQARGPRLMRGLI